MRLIMVSRIVPFSELKNISLFEKPPTTQRYTVSLKLADLFSLTTKATKKLGEVSLYEGLKVSKGYLTASSQNKPFLNFIDSNGEKHLEAQIMESFIRRCKFAELTNEPREWALKDTKVAVSCEIIKIPSIALTKFNLSQTYFLKFLGLDIYNFL